MSCINSKTFYLFIFFTFGWLGLNYRKLIEYRQPQFILIMCGCRSRNFNNLTVDTAPWWCKQAKCTWVMPVHVYCMSALGGFSFSHPQFSREHTETARWLGEWLNGLFFLLVKTSQTRSLRRDGLTSNRSGLEPSLFRIDKVALTAGIMTLMPPVNFLINKEKSK